MTLVRVPRFGGCYMRNTDSERAGMDHLSVAMLILTAIFWLLGTHLWQPLIWAGWGLLLLTYVRSMSKNKIRRHQENIRFLKYWYPIQSKLTNEMRKYRSKREHRYFKCKSCKQKLRVPRRLNRIQVTCPKCKTTAIKETFRGKIIRIAQNRRQL